MANFPSEAKKKLKRKKTKYLTLKQPQALEKALALSQGFVISLTVFFLVFSLQISQMNCSFKMCQMIVLQHHNQPLLADSCYHASESSFAWCLLVSPLLYEAVTEAARAVSPFACLTLDVLSCSFQVVYYRGGASTVQSSVLRVCPHTHCSSSGWPPNSEILTCTFWKQERQCKSKVPRLCFLQPTSNLCYAQCFSNSLFLPFLG